MIKNNRLRSPLSACLSSRTVLPTHGSLQMLEVMFDYSLDSLRVDRICGLSVYKMKTSLTLYPLLFSS